MLVYIQDLRSLRIQCALKGSSGRSMLLAVLTTEVHGNAIHLNNQKDPLLYHKGAVHGWWMSPNRSVRGRGNHQWPSAYSGIQRCERSWTFNTEPSASNEREAQTPAWNLWERWLLSQKKMETGAVYIRPLLETLDTGVPSINAGEAEVEWNSEESEAWRHGADNQWELTTQLLTHRAHCGHLSR